MNKNPFLNAILAAGYIGLLVLVINGFAQPDQKEDTILIPVVMLSLLTLSAAVMGFLFVAEPLMLFIDGKKQEGLNFFLTTVATFAGIVAILAGIMVFFL